MPSRSQLIASLVNQVLGGASKKALARKFSPQQEAAEEMSEGESEMGDDEMAELESTLGEIKVPENSSGVSEELAKAGSQTRSVRPGIRVPEDSSGVSEELDAADALKRPRKRR